MNIPFGLKALIFSMTLLFSSSGQALDAEELVEARQGLMKLFAVNMDLLGEMIRGNIRYDQKKAQYIANNLHTLAKMNSSALWPRGTSTADRGFQNKTSAKPEIWTNRQEVSLYYMDLSVATEALAKNAGWSVDALEENISDVNLACKGCHRKFRSKK